MPDPKTCALKFKPGTQEYKDCIAYKGANANKAQADFGNIEIQKHNILHQVATVQDQIFLFRNELNKSYGTDDININTGEIKYEDNGKADKKD